jgi:2-polyprenyl-6-methoxyphenol hydroxylase-like FAD-dependent oxidoreductase
VAERPLGVGGAGPVGLLVALRLAGQNISVTIEEALPAIESSPRAMAYLPVAAHELERAGILDAFRKISNQAGRICWRKISIGEVISDFEQKVTLDYPCESLVTRQHDLEHLLRLQIR